MKNDELVSIIIPVYNSAKYIDSTIKSIEEQTYKNYEAIFIDDNSQDNSVDIIKKYMQNNNQIKIIKLNRHRGVSIARNIGIRRAKGRYLTFLDSDDIWLKNKLESQIDFMNKKNCEFAYCSFEYMNDSGTKATKPVKIKEKLNYNQALSNIRILTITAIIDLNKIPKRYCYMPNEMNEDVLTWWKILKKGYTAYGQNEVLAYYRKTKNSRSSNKYITVFYRWKAYRKIEKLRLLKSIKYFINYILNAIIKRTSNMSQIERITDIQVAVSTQNLKNDREVDELIKKMNIVSKYLIINQVNQEKIDIKNENVITKNEKGLSKSRNNVINNANEKIVLLADDDVIYNNEYKKIMLKYWNKYNDADIICFYIESKNKKRKIKKIRNQKVNWINAMKVQSVEISFKKESILKNQLYFNENFGIGTSLNRGEEQIFLYEALRKKLKVLFINKKIGEVLQISSNWHSYKYDEKFFLVQGKIFKQMSPKYYKLLIWQYAIRKYLMYRKDISFYGCLKNMFKA